MGWSKLVGCGSLIVNEENLNSWKTIS